MHCEPLLKSGSNNYNLVQILGALDGSNKEQFSIIHVTAQPGDYFPKMTKRDLVLRTMNVLLSSLVFYISFQEEKNI